MMDQAIKNCHREPYNLPVLLAASFPLEATTDIHRKGYRPVPYRTTIYRSHSLARNPQPIIKPHTPQNHKMACFSAVMMMNLTGTHCQMMTNFTMMKKMISIIRNNGTSSCLAAMINLEAPLAAVILLHLLLKSKILREASLLSGLFLSELSTKTTTPPAMTPVTAQHPTLEESSVVAVGDVTPSSYRKSGSVFSQEIPQDAVTAQPVPSKISAGFKRVGSFSSIISDSTLQRYAHQSNAPPTAQTILPTALSTHMFLPNNVHQQRAARSISSRPGSSRRRESMDIPSKNRNNSFLKTRMELSEEEEFVRSTSGR